MEAANKEYPNNYPADVIEILEAMSLQKGDETMILGSMALRSQQYAGDYDAYEVVKGMTPSEAATRFKQIVKTLGGRTNVYIMDMKIGQVDDEPLRWTVAEVAAGKKAGMSLEDAIQSRGRFKLDVIGLVGNNRYTDFSIIYELHHKGEIITEETKDVGTSLKEAIAEEKADGNYFKVLKRKFSLAKFKNQTSVLKKLTPILNSDLGRLYQVSSDINTLLELLEEHKDAPLTKIHFEIDQFKARLANIYQTPSFLKKENAILKELNAAVKTSNRKLLSDHLTRLYDQLTTILNTTAKGIKV